MASELGQPMSVATIIVTTLGTGILFMPASFEALGYVQATFALLGIGALTFFTLYSLAYASIATETKENPSYPRLAGSFSLYLKYAIYCGFFGRNISNTILTVRYFSATAAKILEKLGVPGGFETLRKGALCFLVLAFCFFGMKRRITSLFFISRLSIAGSVGYLIFISYCAFAFGNKLSSIAPFSNNYSSGLSRVVFALHCQSGFLNVFGEMKDKGLPTVRKVVAISSLITAIIYCCSGMFGYLAFGNGINGKHILEVLAEKNNPLSKALLSSKLWMGPGIISVFFLFIWFGFIIFSYFPILSLVEGLKGPGNLKIKRAHAVAAAAFFFFAIGIPSKMEPGIILKHSATFFTCPLGFIFPSIFMFLSAPRRSAEQFLACLIVFLSLCFMGYMILITK